MKAVQKAIKAERAAELELVVKHQEENIRAEALKQGEEIYKNMPSTSRASIDAWKDLRSTDSGSGGKNLKDEDVLSSAQKEQRDTWQGFRKDGSGSTSEPQKGKGKVTFRKKQT